MKVNFIFYVFVERQILTMSPLLSRDSVSFSIVLRKAPRLSFIFKNAGCLVSSPLDVASLVECSTMHRRVVRQGIQVNSQYVYERFNDAVSQDKEAL